MSFIHSNRETDSPLPETRELLLHAAAEIFTEVGYHAATVREICQRAKANIAAINYHFGDKEHLYLEVLRHSHSQETDWFRVGTAADRLAPPPARLRAFVSGFLHRLLDATPGAGFGKLIAMEMINPTQALETLIEERIRPMADCLGEIVEQILGPRATPDLVRLCGCSIVSQCLFYQHCRSVVDRLFPEQRYGIEDIEQLADYITQFSLAALEHCGPVASGEPRGTRVPRAADSEGG